MVLRVKANPNGDKTMTEIQKLQQEIDETNKRLREVKEANTVEDTTPAIKRGFTYRKNTIIRGLEAIV